MDYDDEELLQKARALLNCSFLSGASIEFLERILEDGFPEADQWDEDFEETQESAQEDRRKIKELCLIHNI